MDNAQPVSRMIGEAEIRQFDEILQRYRSGKIATDHRIQSSENWWRLRNAPEEEQAFGGPRKETKKNPNFKAVSAWLHNVIANKHADAMESYPEAIFLPRDADDREEAQRLTDIMPEILRNSNMYQVYSDLQWDKLKYGTGIYKVTWDPTLENGLGGIAVDTVDPLNLYWEPGIRDIQDSRYVFQLSMINKDTLLEDHPELVGKPLQMASNPAEYSNTDGVNRQDMVLQIDVYYKRFRGGRRTLQLCQYVGSNLIYASENDPELAQRGLYDHGKYPYVFDTLFPDKGSLCGHGFVDIGKSPQMTVDYLRTAFIKNARMGAVPRVFSRQDGNINEEDYCNPDKTVVPVTDLNDISIRPIEHQQIDAAYLNVADAAINELRETTGNTDAAAGSTPAGVTAASAIAALQEASGKGSRDSTRTSHNAFKLVVELCVELDRQFMSAPRSYRITDNMGREQFISYDNSGLQPVPQMGAGGPAGYRLPVFQIDITVQRKAAYTRIAQNELALQFYNLGFFNPQMSDQAVACLQMMDFDGRDEVIQRISQNGLMAQKLALYQQMAFQLASAADPAIASQIAQDMGMDPTMAPMGSAPQEAPRDPTQEATIVQNAREKAANTAAV